MELKWEYLDELYREKYFDKDVPQVYLKSEADKVISDLKENHKKEVEQLLILNREQANAANRLRDSMERVIRHHKYKRCLAMAGRCRLRGRLFGACGLYEKELWALKWHKRWLELADKFKEAK